MVDSKQWSFRLNVEMKMIVLLYIFGTTILLSQAVRIVGIPQEGLTHSKALSIIGAELVKRGHQFTLIQFNRTKQWPGIRTHVVQVTSHYHSTSAVSGKASNLWKTVHGYMMMERDYDYQRMDTHACLKDADCVRLLCECDLVIGEVGMLPALLMANRFQKRLVGVQILSTNMVNTVYRMPASPLYVPSHMSWNTDRMSLVDKCFNYALHYTVMAYADLMSWWLGRQWQTEFNLTQPSSLFDYSIIISSLDPLIDYPQPLHSNFFTPGIWTLEPRKPLPAKYLDFVSRYSSRGIIVVSFGTIFRLEREHSNIVNAFLEVFKSLDYGVIVSSKTHGNITKHMSAHILVDNFIPQNDLLAHPSVKLFLSHVGILSMREACYHGVPVIAVPRAFDQHQNAFQLEHRLKMARTLDFDPADFKRWPGIIESVLNDTSMQNNAKRCSKMLHSRPADYAKERAADIVEDFIKWDYNASHLRPYVLDMPVYEYFMLDVCALLCIALVLPYYYLKYQKK